MESPPHWSPDPARQSNERQYFGPILTGVLGATQLSTACVIGRPQNSSDFLLTGAGSSDMIWSVPLGALLGSAIGWLLLWSCPATWRTRRNSWLVALAVGFLASPLAPGFLGLGPQTQVQLWQGFAALSAMTWFIVIVLTQLERTNWAAIKRS